MTYHPINHKAMQLRVEALRKGEVLKPARPKDIAQRAEKMGYPIGYDGVGLYLKNVGQLKLEL